MGNDVRGASTPTEGHQTSAARGVKVPRIAYTLSIALVVVTTVATGVFGRLLYPQDGEDQLQRGPPASPATTNPVRRGA